MLNIKKIKNKLKLKSFIFSSFLVGNEPEVYIIIVSLFLKKRVPFTLCLNFQISINLLYIIKF